MLRAVVDREARHMWTDASAAIELGGYLLNSPVQAPCSDFAFSIRAQSGISPPFPASLYSLADSVSEMGNRHVKVKILLSA